MNFSLYLFNPEGINAHSLTFKHGENPLIVICNKLTKNNHGCKDILNVLVAKIQIIIITKICINIVFREETENLLHRRKKNEVNFNFHLAWK